MLEIPPALSPVDTDSFAYITFRDRLPVIITRIVDYVYRNKKSILESHGDDKIECIKYITSELSRLRHELTTDKIITMFEGEVNGDEKWWNDAIDDERKRLIENGGTNDDEIHWFKTSFLFGENYMYRRIWDIVLKSGFGYFDQFFFEKEEQLDSALKVAKFLSNFLVTIKSSLSFCDKSELEVYFEIFLKMSLWGNEADLSLSVSEDECKLKIEDPRVIVANNNSKLLVDDYRSIFEYLHGKSRHNPGTTSITFILDNCGSELVTDLHFIDFLLESRLASLIVVAVKSFPWYVSDVTEPDISHTLASLSSSTAPPSSQSLARSIASHIAEHRIVIEAHPFFTLPHPYHRMQSLFPDLYAKLAQSSLLIFKGDLNYRKLVSDLSWHHVNTSFHDSLLGFHPAPLVALRVLKCDVQVGLSAASFNRAVSEFPNDWMIKCRYGVVQSSDIPQ